MTSSKSRMQDLVKKIEARVREAMQREGVLELEAYRRLKNKKNPRTILLIEDDDSLRSALVRVLQGEGYSVKPAADGAQLANILDDTPIDLIILDVGLPWIDGYELAQILKGHEQLREIPLIFVSGHIEEKDVRRGFEVGADDYIKKPFDLEHIKKTVNVLLQLAYD